MHRTTSALRHAAASRSAPPRRPHRRPLAHRPRLEALESRTCLSGGLLDPSFNGTGTETLPTSTASGAFATATDQSGRTVSEGIVYVNGLSQIAVMRLNPNGSLDKTFNGTGVADIKVGKKTYSGPVVIQPDGKILVAGFAFTSLFNDTDSEFVIARLNADGSLDKSFGKGGTFVWNPTSGDDQPTGMAVLSDGSIVVTALTSLNGDAFGALKLTASGALIRSFGNNGLAAVKVGDPNQDADGPGGMVIAPDGDILMAGGVSNGQAAIVALTPMGQLDTSFGSGGIVEALPTGFSACGFSSIVLQGNAILVSGSATSAGATTSNGLVARYSLTGVLDTSFGTGGDFVTSNASSLGTIALESDGSIVVGGSQNYVASDGTTHSMIAVAHLSANGAADTTFGTLGTGFAYVQIGQDSAVYGLAIESGGNIFVCGTSQSSGTSRQAGFARFTAP
jgi:uncharacterized delta-60 repeat protein